METALRTALITDAKVVLRLHTNAFNGEIGDLIDAAAKDLINKNAVQESMLADPLDPLIKRAIMTYAKANFGEPENPERLQKDYAMQCATLMNTTGYTNWEA